MNLEEIYARRFENEFASRLRRAQITTDSAGVVTAPALTTTLLQALVKRKICAIHIPRFCDKNLARKAAQAVMRISTPTNWRLPNRKKGIRTDTNFGIGYPRQMAMISARARQRYINGALKSIRTIRGVFAPQLSPMDKLRLELDELWSGGATIANLGDHKGFAGIIRIMKPKTMYPGTAGRRGICHVDGDMAQLGFSSNIYLRVPEAGGELAIWNIPLNAKTSRNPLYQLISRKIAFDPEIQEILHARLPKPLLIKPQAGDLVIIDTSRPHSVCGFAKGERISIQSFISTAATQGARLDLFS